MSPAGGPAPCPTGAMREASDAACVQPGFLNAFKPIGARSTQVVAAVRRATGVRRVGHCGTLDPLAQGVLPIAIGRATRLSADIVRMPKTYFACVLFGVRTDSDDLEGAAIGEFRPSPELDDVKRAIGAFRGRIRQRPPAHSAVHVDGQRAYARARAGEAVDVPVREVTVYQAEVIGHDRIKVGRDGARVLIDDARARLESLAVGIRIECSSGTYVRSIARDLGESVGSGAMLIGLLRAAVGPFTLANACEVWQIDMAAQHGYLDRLLFPADAAVEALPAHIAGDQLRLDLIHGRSAPAPGGRGGPHRLYDADGEFIGVARAEDGRWHARRIFAQDA